MRAAVLSAVAALLQAMSVQVFPQYQHATDPAWDRLDHETAPSAWTKDFTIEVSEIDGLPIPSLAQTPKSCLDNREKDDDCFETRPVCHTRTYCEYIRLDPYLGHARRVTVRGQTTLAMARGKTIANVMVQKPGGTEAEALKWADFDNVVANNLLADTRTPDWIEPASAADIAAYTPPRAINLSIAGAVVLDCVAEASGALKACDPLAAHPSNLGFEHTAAALAEKKYRVRAGAGQTHAGAKVRLRIDFPASLEFRHIDVVY